MKLKFILIILLVSMLSAKAQDRAKFIGIEAGGDFIGCKSVDKDYIRADMSTNYYYGDASFSRSIQSQMYRVYMGAKIEFRTINDKFGILSGIRFSQLNSSITKNTSPDYFYLLYQQTNTTTEFLRIHQLSQTSNSIGVPVEVRYFPFPKLKRFRLYFMVGAEINYQVALKTTVTFQDQAMQSYQDAVAKIIGTPSKLNGLFYGGAGFRIGKEGKPGFNIGINVPVFPSNKSSKLNTPVAGGGLHIQLQIPF